MKKLQVISVIVLIISVAGFIIWRFAIPYSEWFVRVNGVFMLVSIFTTVFSTVKITMVKK